MNMKIKNFHVVAGCRCSVSGVKLVASRFVQLGRVDKLKEVLF